MGPCFRRDDRETEFMASPNLSPARRLPPSAQPPSCPRASPFKLPGAASSIDPRDRRVCERRRRHRRHGDAFHPSYFSVACDTGNADPSVLSDLTMALDRLAPEDAGWSHDTEGPDDMPAHVKTMLTTTSLQIPFMKGELMLGTWQAIYLIEHRTSPHRREIVLQFVGAAG